MLFLVKENMVGDEILMIELFGKIIILKLILLLDCR